MSTAIKSPYGQAAINEASEANNNAFNKPNISSKDLVASGEGVLASNNKSVKELTTGIKVTKGAKFNFPSSKR